MKSTINRLLKPFNLEVHGKNYIKKLRNSDPQKDAFETQQRLLKSAKFIFDVGANRGAVTKRYAEMYPGAAIFAFEPFRDFSGQFHATNGGNINVHFVNKALSDKIGNAILFVNNSPDTNSIYPSVQIGATSDRSCTNLGQTEVETETVDHFCTANGIAHIDILKMDTQGSELSILKGAQTLLAQKKIALVYTEAYFQPQYKEQPLFYDIASYLKGFGYFLEDTYEPYYNERHLLWCDAIFIPKNQ